MPLPAHRPSLLVAPLLLVAHLDAGADDAPTPWADTQIARTADGLVAAIGDDQRTVLVTRSSGRWEPLTPPGTFTRLTGLTTDGTSLFVADAGQKALYRIGLPTAHVASVADLGAVEPGELAYASRPLLVDARARDLVLVGSGLPNAPLGMGKLLAPTGPIHVGGDGGRRVVATAPEDALILLTVSADLKGVVDATYAYGATPVSQPSRAATAVPLTPFPRLGAVRSVSMRNGLIYLAAEDDTCSILESTTPEEGPRPVRLVKCEGESPVAALFADVDHLTVLRSSGNAVSWHRYVAAEISFPRSTRVDPLPEIYSYLLKRGVMPTRKATIERNVEETLRREGLLVNAYPVSMTEIVCRLNPRLCRNGEIQVVHAGDPLTVPDITQIRYLEFSTSPAGTAGLAPKPASKPSFEELQTVAQELRTTLQREERADSVKRAVEEYVRYVFVAKASDVEAKHVGPAAPDLSNIERAVRRAFETDRKISEGQILPRVRTLSIDRPGPSGSAAPTASTDSQDLLKAVRSTIQYCPLETQESDLVSVGIVEKAPMDFGRADFTRPQGSVFVNATTSLLGSASTAPEDPEGDHATMVSWMLAAQATQSAGGGLLPAARYRYIPGQGTQLGEGLRQAVGENTRLFNISLDYEDEIPTELTERMSQEDLLFVIAAGNHARVGDDSGELCKVKRRLPCLGGDNTIVVTATDVDGVGILPPQNGAPGANWSYKKVDVAAPGDGFRAGARGDRYVSARGTSFAAPIATAAAGFLMAQRITQPAVIKRRLIATADPVLDPTKTRGGRLNFCRAISHPGQSSLHRLAGGAPEIVDVVGPDLVHIVTHNGEHNYLNPRNLLRFTVVGDHYRAIYVLRSGEPGDQGTLQVSPNVTLGNPHTLKLRDGTEVDLADVADYVGPAR